MCTTIPARVRGTNQVRLSAGNACAAALLAAAFLATTTFSVAAQQPAPSSTTPSALQPKSSPKTTKKPVRAHRKPTAAHTIAPALPPPVIPEPPKLPDWPANDRPSVATVTWNSQGLRIDASNSSLQQILHEVSTLTGAKIQGLGPDERIFGTYGPGSARDVLSQLFEGAGYNILMIGDQGQGTPRQIVLTSQPNGQGPAPSASIQNPQSDENAEAAEQQEQPEPRPQPPMRNGFAPGAPPRTPQQIMQEMQQRQQQMQQQNAPQY